MNTHPGSVRSLRYALGCALADAVDEDGRPRTAEAVTELDLALAEAGADPPDRCIELAAGRMLEASDPAQALQRYVSALDGDTAEEAAVQARALLEASPKPATLAAPISTRELERVARLVQGSEQVTLLASTLLRLRGRDADALELLERAYENARPPGQDVLSHLAETRLDLDQVDETVALVEREDPGGREPSLQLVRAHAFLIRGEYEEALELANRLSIDGADVPALDAVAALSLLGLDRLDKARSILPASDEPEIQLARAIVSLQRREYQSAREAASALLRSRPNDPDVLLVNAQAVVEALGASQDEASGLESSSATNEGQTPGAEIDAARRLMDDVAQALDELGPRLRWWRTQAAVRVKDGPYRYFSCELQFARHSGPSLKEIDDVDRGTTSYLQDGALEEIKAAVLKDTGDDEGAAAAFDEACNIFRSSAVDTQRALECARNAHELAATLERSLMYAERALYASYGPNVDPNAARQALDVAREPAERSLPEARDDNLERLVNVLAWARFRLNELAEPDGPDKVGLATSTAALLPWLFAGVAVRPSDADLRAALAFQLGNLDLFASAALEANAAAAADPGSDYVADSALTANTNYFGDPEKAAPLIARVSGDDAYRNSVELHVFLAAGDRAELEERRRRPIYDDLWAKIDHAFATVLLDGIAEATPNLEAVLEAIAAERQNSIPDSVVIAALLRRREDAATYLADGEGDSETDEADLLVGRLVEQFGFEPEMTAEEYFSRNLELCRAPIECALLANVMLPLLAAARSGSTGPVQVVTFDQDLLRARMAELEDLRARSVDELEKLCAGMGSLVVLSDADAGPAELSAAAAGAQAAWPEELSSSVGDRIVRLVVRRACDKLPLRLVEARLDLGPPVDAADVLLAIDGDSGLTVSKLLSIALLDDSLDASAREAIAGRATADDLDAAAREIREALGEVRPEAEEEWSAARIADYWKVDALLQAMQDDPEGTTSLREAAASVRDELVLRLDNLLGLVKDGSETPVLSPIAVEVGDALVPIVDSRQDGGRFLYELIPAMRDRILAGMGVTVPGVRMRGGPTLALDGYSIQIDDVRVLGGTAPLDVSRAVVPVGNGGLEPSGEVTDFHPLTGERGLWSLNPVRDGGDGGGAPLLDPAEYLIHRIELVLRTQLARLLGPQEVDDLVGKWAQDDGKLVSAVLPDDARLRLTWVLQALVDDGVPITEWRALLTAISEAGGITAPVRSLVHAARSRLRDELPGPRTGRTLVVVPPELEAALTGLPPGDAGSSRDPQHEFLRWLRQTVSASGPAIALVTTNDESRERVGALARAEGGLITALSEDELTPE